MAAIDRLTPLDELPELLRVEELAAWADCGKGTVYEAIRCNALAHVRIGRLVRIPRSALAAWVRKAEESVA